MKKLVTILGVAFSVIACSEALPEGFTELARKNEGMRADVYYGAPGFNAQDEESWRKVRDAVALAAELRPSDGTLVVHFLDTTTFEVPANGNMYGGEAIRQRVIAQCTIQPNGHLEYQDDPFGTNRYKNPNQ
ncbi:hypothetical protein GCM10023185_06700 [Hymenobacter saemangeumensis]|uniref:Lipoprotein n=1 Tax=Hymenobacter saemangeumensis TaxID=1084522 RepID=A0ABP8I1Z6_9BACT